MLYTMSDLHGCYEKYKQMLDILRFGDDDTLYILGDIVDHGDGGIRILQDMMQHKNIIPFWGNHDYMAYLMLKFLYNLEVKRNVSLEEPSIEEYLLKMEGYCCWIEIGGKKTFDAFKVLDRDSQKKVLDYMDTFRFFQEIEINKRKFFLSHTVPDKKTMLDFVSDRKDWFLKNKSEYEFYFVASVPEYNKIYFEDRYIITGHTPTGFINENYVGKIYQENRHIAIDCGAVYGGPLGCICLNTLEEFYTSTVNHSGDFQLVE